MRPLLSGVRTASSDEQLKSLWDDFKTQFPQASKLIDFIEKKWMTPEKSRWTIFSREVSVIQCCD